MAGLAALGNQCLGRVPGVAALDKSVSWAVFERPLEADPSRRVEPVTVGSHGLRTVWVLRPLLRRTIVAPDLDFIRITDPVLRPAAEQYLGTRQNRTEHPGKGRAHFTFR